jgi:hypothetical protein
MRGVEPQNRLKQGLNKAKSITQQRLERQQTKIKKGLLAEGQN